MDEWWKDQQFRRALDNALDLADWRGLSVGPFGVRIATDEDGKMTLSERCEAKLSSVRKEGQGLDIYMCGPAGPLELFVRGEQIGFLPVEGKDKPSDRAAIRKQIQEFGEQLRRGLSAYRPAK